jgi:ribulose-5-phosphate 4-epimerase/fuculose-1-phosphate aldolase
VNDEPTGLVSEETRARDGICRLGASLHARGYAHGSAGNISLRLADGRVLITPGDASLGALDPARLALVDAEGQPLAGDRPSKTLALHRRVYAAAPGARCVLHTHSTHLVALSMAGVWNPSEVLPPITPYQVMKVGTIPLVPYQPPGDPLVGDEIAARLRQRPLLGVLLERLGPLVWHRDLASAGAVLEELEETARLWLMLDPRPKPLGPGVVRELQRRFGDPAQAIAAA